MNVANAIQMLLVIEDQGINNIVIIAHSLGTVMTSYYLSHQPKKEVQAFIGISMSEISGDRRMSNVAMLKSITLPLLDIYGSLDEAHVRNFAQQRQQSATTANNQAYRQIEIKDANHFYHGKDDELLTVIQDWISHYAVAQ